ncbi:hypothetical protein [Geodermatophilus ruber]|uniref:Uncharacterized protein n=1 Tax=Geodermatophilus ruber TaxID=504800 RepID=A0A1I4IAZ4_9ACTN|nr:hypothetical protein [Geodermatophilus ruber]SFL51542.1 hypothetical protein SAMN04488085_112135 [Geodermatophilus ruber]
MGHSQSSREEVADAGRDGQRPAPSGRPGDRVRRRGLLALFLRWAFAPDERRRPPTDDGLLTPVATLARRESALALRAVLSDAGIRSTVRGSGPHRVEVLVFPEDADRAARLAASFPAG